MLRFGIYLLFGDESDGQQCNNIAKLRLCIERRGKSIIRPFFGTEYRIF